MPVDLEQSIPICCGLAALGGILEVFATAVLAYPASRSAEGYEWTDRQLKACLAANIIFQILASIAGNLCATWFGPVAIVGPIFFAAQLLANLVVFWIVLGLEAFSREMQIGTYVIVVAVVLLIVNGPTSQDYGDRTFQDLITEFYAMIWACLLVGGMLATGLVLALVNLHKSSAWFKYTVLLTARATAFALNLSTGKALVLPTNQFWLTMNIVVKIVSGSIYTHAIVVQSTAVEQKVFVPINAAFIVLINALTGIIIWEDWRVVANWIGYVCVFLLLALGCGLLLGDLGLLQESSPETFMGARPSMFYKENRTDMLDRLKHFGKQEHTLSQLESVDEEKSPTHNRRNSDFAFGSHREDPNMPSSSFRGTPMRPIRRNTTAISTPVSRPMRNNSAGRLSMSDTMMMGFPSPGLRERRPSLFSPPRNHRVGWASVYEGAGATSNRSSAVVHSLFIPGTDCSVNSTHSNSQHQLLPSPTPPPRPNIAFPFLQFSERSDAGDEVPPARVSDISNTSNNGSELLSPPHQDTIVHSNSQLESLPEEVDVEEVSSASITYVYPDAHSPQQTPVVGPPSRSLIDHEDLEMHGSVDAAVDSGALNPDDNDDNDAEHDEAPPATRLGEAV